MRQYSLPLHYEVAVMKEFTQLLNMGIIVFSYTAYSAPLIPVLKKSWNAPIVRGLHKVKSRDTGPERTYAKPRGYVPEIGLKKKSQIFYQNLFN